MCTLESLPRKPGGPQHLVPGCALLQIFEGSKKLEKQGWKFTMQASMLEIYNEEYKDLLSKRSKPAQGAKDSQAGDGKKHQASCTGLIAGANGPLV